MYDHKYIFVCIPTCISDNNLSPDCFRGLLEFHVCDGTQHNTLAHEDYAIREKSGRETKDQMVGHNGRKEIMTVLQSRIPFFVWDAVLH